MPVPYSNIGMKFCKHCKKSSSNGECIYKLFGCYCPILPEEYEFIKAAEFEARVAVLLAQQNIITFPCALEHCYVKESCAWCRLKSARLAVEEEMDG